MSPNSNNWETIFKTTNFYTDVYVYFKKTTILIANVVFILQLFSALT